MRRKNRKTAPNPLLIQPPREKGTTNKFHIKVVPLRLHTIQFCVHNQPGHEHTTPKRFSEQLTTAYLLTTYSPPSEFDVSN